MVTSCECSMGSSDRKPLVVIGTGSILMCDEGIGIHIVHRLMQEAMRFPEVDFVDAGASSMKVVHAIAGRRKAVIIDCALMNEPPGTMRKFSPADVVTAKSLAHLSLHEGDLLMLSRSHG